MHLRDLRASQLRGLEIRKSVMFDGFFGLQLQGARGEKNTICIHCIYKYEGGRSKYGVVQGGKNI